ncbi:MULTISPECIES: InlB B-repeat-containing protein [unclassified Oceanispirochaeta]|uniref:InlB B-repeat-containing protein n=1 Tax=unclassified Oceanispirochaeta TaxID=2635722 RepID=UPI000E091DBE|nr:MULTISPECIES: InlB B-repeat-containing protein [unclassified Oceanispirochaeta]MBF9019014.1 InlB B-repeat-containing protein [Oceanispirochaeta sp. M2]NPD75512.1 hypothetical protein [Oceanispirochaeta sp. M1]RDG28633.1 hypothetical protein DV872_25810 [Oceanispirochaeta sp. M1]
MKNFYLTFKTIFTISLLVLVTLILATSCRNPIVKLGSYQVIYDGNGADGGDVPIDENGSLPKDTRAYSEGDEVVVLDSSNLTKTGYKFNFWNTKADGSGILYTPGETLIMDKENITLYAQWLIIQTYNIIYSGNEYAGLELVIDYTSYSEGSPVTILDKGNMIFDGYAFLGWNPDSDGEEAIYTAGEIINMPGHNLSLYAVWTQLPTFSITYNGNQYSGLNVPTDGNQYLEGTEVTVLDQGDMILDGYSFVGWNTDSERTMAVYTAGQKIDMPAYDETLYAVWTQLPTYSINYEGNQYKGSDVPEDNNQYIAGSLIKVPNQGEMILEGYTCTGWDTEADGSGTFYLIGSEISMPDNDITLYAQWEIIPILELQLSEIENSVLIEDQIQLSWEYLPKGVIGQNVSFSSSDETILTITDNGIVEALNEGTAVISISSSDGIFEDEIEICVLPTFIGCIDLYNSGALSVNIPISSSNSSSNIIDWGDGTRSTWTTSSGLAHSYSETGWYDVRIGGDFIWFGINSSKFSRFFSRIENWGG